jgi:Tc5 transposase DNA-binding domain
MEKLIVPWLEKMSKAKQPITDSSIRTKAREVAQALHISHNQFKASSGWVDNFKRRHNIRKGVYRGGQLQLSALMEIGSGQSELQEISSVNQNNIELHQNRAQLVNEDQQPGPSLEQQSSPSNTHSTSNENEPALSDQSLIENWTTRSRLRDAFATIFSWIDSNGPGFLSSEERTLLDSLVRRI